MIKFPAMMIVILLFLLPFQSEAGDNPFISQKIKLVSYSLVLVIGLVLLYNSLFRRTEHAPSNPGGDAPAGSPGPKGLLPLALAVGIVPCPGVVIITMFALSFNLLAIGLLMSFIMALGMASTISTAGLLTILGQEGLLKGLSGREGARHRIQKGLAVFGSLLIIGFGGILLAGAL